MNGPQDISNYQVDKESKTELLFFFPLLFLFNEVNTSFFFLFFKGPDLNFNQT